MIDKILIIDDDVEFATQLGACLSSNYNVVVANSIQAALSYLVDKFDLVFCDAALPDIDLRSFVIQLKQIQPDIHVVVTTNQIQVNHFKNLIYCGVSDFIAKPVFIKEVAGVIKNLKPVAASRKIDFNNKGLVNDCFAETSCIDWIDLSYNQVSNNSQVNFEYLVNQSKPIFITGESCTAKLNYAYKMHKASDRLNKPFVVFNCAQIMPDLMHKMLFGYEKGAFVGAFVTTPGVLEEAIHGTLVLNGVDHLTSECQLALTNAIKNNTFNRIGGAEKLTTQINFIATTTNDNGTIDLKQTFRPDFFQLFLEEPLSTTPFRHLKRDVLPIVDCILQRINKLYETNVLKLSTGVEQLFKNYNWPGNIAELYFVLRRAALLSDNDTITTAEIDVNIAHAEKFTAYASKTQTCTFNVNMFNHTTSNQENKQLTNLKDVAVEAEIEAINQVLRNVKFNKTKAAMLLGIDRKTLYNKLLKNKKEEQSSN